MIIIVKLSEMIRIIAMMLMLTDNDYNSFVYENLFVTNGK